MNSIIARLALEVWAIEPRALEALFAKLETAPRGPFAQFADVFASRELAGSGDPCGFFDDEEEEPRNVMSIVDGVARIPVSGFLLKSVPKWAKVWGVDATGYDDIAANLAKAVESAAVRAIVLDVESPGGQAAGIEIAVAAVRDAALRKPVSAEVGGLCASAAYWIASQASEISAPANSMVGSIGCLCTYVDASAWAEKAGYKVHVIASGPHKGMGVWGAPITEAQIAAMRENIEAIANNFARAVAQGRRATDEKVKGWATGRVWEAGKAVEIGLIDRLGKHSAAGSGSRSEAASIEETISEATIMTEQEKKEAADKAAAAALTQERKRTADIRAAFPKNVEFAMQAIEKGWTVVEARAAYADVLEQKAEADQKALAEAQGQLAAAKSKITAGADPISAAGSSDPGTKSKGDFMATARAYNAEHKCGIVAAMRHVAATQPELHRAFLQAAADSAPAVREAKIKLGMTV